MYLGVLPSSPWQHQRIWPASPDFTAHSMDPAFYTDLTRNCDQAGIDFLFLPDKQVANASPPDPAVADSWFDPLTLLAFLAAQTDRIGLVPTLSTTWFEPFPLARQIISLDHLSGGRAGWNAVSSHPGLEDANFAHRPALAPEEMKARHAEAVSLVKALWSSWDSDAATHDAATAQWFRPGSVRPVDHHGEFFDVTGPLTLSQSPQDSPVLFMAGASENFLRTAAKDAGTRRPA
ncbi:LLM class flavin-dependent oxidoreductase [Corynebacterium variabile]|uniref:LLM class flavin-dependent oxidoreductase n=1 Tax=Corynebacterium variabile TaxID=1727 RepID=UPI003FD07090